MHRIPKRQHRNPRRRQFQSEDHVRKLKQKNPDKQPHKNPQHFDHPLLLQMERPNARQFEQREADAQVPQPLEPKNLIRWIFEIDE